MISPAAGIFMCDVRARNSFEADASLNCIIFMCSWGRRKLRLHVRIPPCTSRKMSHLYIAQVLYWARANGAVQECLGHYHFLTTGSISLYISFHRIHELRDMFCFMCSLVL